jgi:Lon protease-like protein
VCRVSNAFATISHRRVLGAARSAGVARGAYYAAMVDELGLFPLPVVLLPTERIPLHIFEPRYLELIDECVGEGHEFGLVLVTDDAFHPVGTRAAVAEILERLDDGRLNIVVEGGERFRIVEVTEGRSFTTALVEPVEDDDEAAPELARALDLFTSLADEAESNVDIPDSDSPLLDFELAARVDFAPDDKQDLLASTSPAARAERLADLLGLALEAVRTEKQLRERAGQNGKVTPLEPPT